MIQCIVLVVWSVSKYKKNYMQVFDYPRIAALSNRNTELVGFKQKIILEVNRI